jgi:hypothetical protein
VSNTHIILAYKNFAANRFVSHIGLGVTAMNSAKSLRSMGYSAEVWPIVSSQELRTRLNAIAVSKPATHVVISAPWIPTLELASLANDFPDTHFLVTCHSNLGFCRPTLAQCGLSERASTSSAPPGISVSPPTTNAW